MAVWSAADDAALVESLSGASSLSGGLALASTKLGRPISRDAADKRLHRIGKPSAAALLGTSGIETAPEIPIFWEDGEDEDEEPETNRDAYLRRKVLAPSVQRILFIPDVHSPYHDRKAWALAMACGRALAPDIVVQLGDAADMYSVSFHSKDPSRRHNLRTEIDVTNQVFDDMDRLGAKEKHFVRGNHEYRLQRFIHEKAPALDGMFELGELLNLEERGWTDTPYMDFLKIGRLHVTHEEGNAGPHAHQKARGTFEGNVVIGHTHRSALHYQGNAQGQQHVAAMFGWLGNVEAIDYAHRVKALQWQHGVGVGLLEPNGNVHLHPVPFIEGAAYVLGERVTA